MFVVFRGTAAWRKEAGRVKSSLKEMSSGFIELVEEFSAADSEDSFRFSEVSKA